MAGRMKVLVKLVGPLAQGMDRPEFWIYLDEGSTVEDLLRKLELEKRVRIEPGSQSIVILVNGRSIALLEDLKTRLRDLDEVAIMPFAFGGSNCPRALSLAKL